jgi:hypothetical protein
MIHLLAESLRQAGIDFTIRELDDILWLASKLTTDAAPDAVADPSAAGPLMDEETFGIDLEPIESASAEVPIAPDASPDPAKSAALYANTQMEGRISASVLRVPGVAGSPGPGELRRALQPFARRVASGLHAELDEESTANGAAESGLWLPVFRPLRERILELSLVIEDCTSASLRARALSELAAHLRLQGGLRRVDVYRLAGSSEMRVTTESGAEVGLTRLTREDSSHLVLFATDGTSLRWRNGVAPAFLHAVGARSSVSILHLLPQDAWPHTLVGPPDLVLHAGHPGEANRRMRFQTPHWIAAEEVAACLPVPVLGMEADDMARWARTVSARGGAGMPGVLIAPAVPVQTPEPAGTDKAGRAPAPDPGSAERVARFRQMASQAAFDLAVFLSPADALTIPIMRLVQRTMSPNGGDGELAEFILGGLVVPTRQPSDGGEQVYRFRDGVAAELFRALRYSEEHTIRRQLRLVGRFLEEEADQGAAFAGTFPAPDGQATITEWALPFAELSRDALHRFANPGTPMPSGQDNTPATPPERPGQDLEPESVAQSAEAEGILTYFVGRERELQRLISLVPRPDLAGRRPFRAMITGPRRVGKTALALTFANTGWSDGGRRLPYLQVDTSELHMHPKGILYALPVAPHHSGFPDALAEELRATSTLLILDNVDGPAQLETVRHLIDRLPGCSFLCAGREWKHGQLLEAAGALQMVCIELQGLAQDESLALLATRAVTVAPDVMMQVADALLGMPAALVAAAARLRSQRQASRLLNWIVASKKPLLSTRLLDDAGRFEDLTRYMQDVLHARYLRWDGSYSQLEDWQSIPLLLAHGPLAGYPLKLAAAIAGLDERSDGPEYLRKFLGLLNGAEVIGLRYVEQWVSMVPLWAMCLRAASVDQAPVVMRRCGRWIARQLAPSHGAVESAWDELDEARPAVLEWLKVCTPKDAVLVCDICVAYALERGPLPQWRAFSERMLSMLPIDDADWGAWQILHEKLTADKDAEVSQGDRSDSEPRTTGFLALSPHQERIAKLVLEAMDTAGRRTAKRRHAGIVVQSLGTGMTMSLIGYLALNAEMPTRLRRSHLIVVDRLEQAKQIVDAYRNFVRSSDTPISMASTPLRLGEDLAADGRAVMVTTVQKLQQMKTGIDANCTVVLFGLRSVTKALIEMFQSEIRLIFSHEAALTGVRFESEYGPLIASYLSDKAVREGVLRQVDIHHERLDFRPGDIPFEEVQNIATRIANETGDRKTKTVLIVANTKAAELLHDTIQRDGAMHCVLAVRSRSPTRLRHAVVGFNRLVRKPAVLVTTAATAMGLYLKGVDVCYVMASVSVKAMFKLESFVSQKGAGRVHGEIVDMAYNDWAALDRVRRLVRAEPH